MSPKAIKGKRKRSAMTVASDGTAHDGFCGGKRRQGMGTCTQAAGWGTSHPGQGRCKLHGGSNPIQHGRYSQISREPIRLLVERHKADPDPLNMLPDLALARAFLEDFIERYDVWREAVLAWWQSWSLTRRRWSVEQVQAFRDLLDDFEEQFNARNGCLTERQVESLVLAREFLEALALENADGRPRQVLDVSAAITMIGEVTKIAERIEKVRAANAISRPDLLRLMAEMGRVVEAHVKDAGAREKIQEGWLAIRVA